MKCFMLGPEHFVRQINHLIIHLNPQSFPDISHPIKTCRVLSVKINRDNIPFILDCLLDKRLFPVQIYNLSIDLPRTKSCRESNNLVIGSIGFFDSKRIIASLCTMFVNRNKNRLQILQIKQKVVHQITDFTFISPAYISRQTNSVHSSERMIGSKYKSPVRFQVLFSVNIQL